MHVLTVAYREVYGVVEGVEDSWIHFRPAELRAEVKRFKSSRLKVRGSAASQRARDGAVKKTCLSRSIAG